MKLLRPNDVDAFGVVGAEVDELGAESISMSFGRFTTGSSLIPAFLLISSRASGPILLH
jgi:hypothetical protein